MAVVYKTFKTDADSTPPTVDRVTLLEGVDTLDIASRGYLNGLNLTYKTAATVDVETGICRDVDDTQQIDVASTLTADLTVSGANGLDTGSEAADTWYSVWVIADSTATNPVASLLSTSQTSPTLPSGYDKKRRVGWIRNDSSSDILRFVQSNKGIDKLVFWEVERANLQVLNAGTATTYTDVHASGVLPPTVSHAFTQIALNTGNAGDMVEIRADGSTVGRPSTFISAGTTTQAGNKLSIQFEMLLTSAIFEYKITKGGGGTTTADIFVTGFIEQL